MVHFIERENKRDNFNKLQIFLLKSFQFIVLSEKFTIHRVGFPLREAHPGLQ